MQKIKIIKGQKKRKPITVDPKKESIIKELASLVESNGYTLRREQLKQGAGWKVMSGSCRFNNNKLIFVDRRLSQSDQISFLVNKCIALGFASKSEALSSLSDDLKQFFSHVAFTPVA